LSRKLGKLPVVVNDGPGFLVNRILMPFLGEALRMLEEGGRIEEIDHALLNFGMPMGAFILLDEIGIDIAHKVSGILRQGLGEHFVATADVTRLGEGLLEIDDPPVRALLVYASNPMASVPHQTKVRRGLASGVYNAAGDMGNILGPSIGGFIAHATGIASVFVVGSLGSTALFFMGVLLVRRIKAGPAPVALDVFVPGDGHHSPPCGGAFRSALRAGTATPMCYTTSRS